MPKANKGRSDGGQFATGHNLPTRPSLYHPSMNEQATKLALLGMTDEEMAKFFGVHVQTFYNWQKEFQPFFEAVQEGKEYADANVAQSFYKRATGEHVELEKVVKNTATGEHSVIKYKTFIPGDAGAALNWLKNRRRQSWADKHEVVSAVSVTHSGSVTISDSASFLTEALGDGTERPLGKSRPN